MFNSLFICGAIGIDIDFELIWGGKGICIWPPILLGWGIKGKNKRKDKEKDKRKGREMGHGCLQPTRASGQKITKKT